MLTVLSHAGDATTLDLPPELAAQVRVVAVATEGRLPDDVSGSVLVTRPAPAFDYADAVSRGGVRWIHFIGTGIDGVPLQTLPPDVTLTNAPGVSATPISEWVVTAMLAFEKRLPSPWLSEPPARWSQPPEPFGTLQGSVVALLGFGGIGAAVAERLVPFGARLRALRRSSTPSRVPGVDMTTDVDALMDGANHLVIAAPLTDSTRGMVDRRVLGRMAPGGHVVNIARGSLMVHDDLRELLDSGHLAGASIDTPDPEPLPAGHWLYEHPKVRLSAHVSWNWPHAHRAMVAAFHENLRRHLAGEPLLDVVDTTVGY